jgi:hypothetical protein
VILLPLPALAAIQEQCDWTRVACQHKSSRLRPGLGQVLSAPRVQQGGAVCVVFFLLTLESTPGCTFSITGAHRDHAGSNLGRSFRPYVNHGGAMIPEVIVYSSSS